MLLIGIKPIHRRIRSAPKCIGEKGDERERCCKSCQGVEKSSHSWVCTGNEIKVECYDAEFGEVDAKVEEIVRHEADLPREFSICLRGDCGDGTFLRATLDIIKSSMAFISYVKVSHISNP